MEVVPHGENHIVGAVFRRLAVDKLFECCQLIRKQLNWGSWKKVSTYPTVNVVVRAVLVVNNRLIVAQHVVAKTRWWAIMVVQSSGEQIRVICKIFYQSKSAKIRKVIHSHPNCRLTSKSFPSLMYLCVYSCLANPTLRRTPHRTPFS